MCFTLGDLHSKLVSDVLYLERSLVTNSAQLTWIRVLVPTPNLQILTVLHISLLKFNELLTPDFFLDLIFSWNQCQINYCKLMTHAHWVNWVTMISLKLLWNHLIYKYSTSQCVLFCMIMFLRNIFQMQVKLLFSKV